MTRTRTGDGYKTPIIQEDDGVLDELVAYNCSVHFEAMDSNVWWIGVTMPDGTMYSIDCGAVNAQAKAFARVEVR